MQATEYIAIVSAVIGAVSAFLAFASYKGSKKQYEQNKTDYFIRSCKESLDDCYVELNTFVSNYSQHEESNEKRIARDKIIFILDKMKDNFTVGTLLNDNSVSLCDEIIMLISDLTYENNFEKIMRDLSVIKEKISKLKEQFFPHKN